jgi:putative two-component system response regulator
MQTAARQNPKILIIDDHADHCLLLQTILREGGLHHHKVITEPRAAISAFHEFLPDLILLDLLMPGLDGFEVLRQLHLCISQTDYLPIAVLTADQSQAAKQKALSLGAKDLVTKPFENAEVLLRIHTLLATRYLHRELEQRNEALDQSVRERTVDVADAQMEVLHRLALVAEHHDDNTGRHTYRVGELAALLGRSLDFPEPGVQMLRMAAPLHDLGKIGIPDSILLKPGKLSAEEYKLIQTHTIIGGRMLTGSKLPILQLAETIALFHHERWDGCGYRGLQSEAIPIEARIVSIADTFDVLTHERPYKAAWPVPDAIAEIRSQSGRQFDPRLVNVFTELLRLDEG